MQNRVRGRGRAPAQQLQLRCVRNCIPFRQAKPIQLDYNPKPCYLPIPREYPTHKCLKQKDFGEASVCRTFSMNDSRPKGATTIPSCWPLFAGRERCLEVRSRRENVPNASGSARCHWGGYMLTFGPTSTHLPVSLPHHDYIRTPPVICSTVTPESWAHARTVWRCLP